MTYDGESHASDCLCNDCRSLSDDPTPDTKGAQPEQLVEENDPDLEQFIAFAEELNDDVGPMFGRDAVRVARAYLALATALSECREALQAWYDWQGFGQKGQPIQQTRDALGVAAQPPSEASERSGT